MVRLTIFALVLLATAHVASARTDGRVTFKASNSEVIELETNTGKLTAPHYKALTLRDCGDRFQACLTDGHRFAFAYFRNCNDAGELRNYKRLRFQPKIVSVLHGNLWMVFDSSPNFLFHYVERTGLVGIYVGPSPSFDFRTLLRKRNWNLSDYALEYRIVPPGTIAACK